MRRIKIKYLQNISSSKFVLFLLSVTLLWTFFNIQRWQFAETKAKIIEQDITWYYSYLPATFIHHDIALNFTRRGADRSYEQNHQFWYQVAPNGGRVNKFTMGLAILYSPFFFAAHLSAYLFNYTANGFSTPYEFFLALSSLFYLFIGLLYLRKLLLLFYNETITSIVLICILLGTNLFYYSTTEPAMSHAYTFSVVAVFLFQFITWYNNPTTKKAIVTGLLFGLIVLVRPVNIIIILFPILYDVYSKQTLINKFNFIGRNWKQIMIIGLATFIVFIPQLIYWKYITGDWLFYSYVDERFYFNHPHILQGLFSYRKGWLLYTPIMVMAILGIINLYKKERKLFLPVLVFLCVNIYVIYCWWTWWYGGSYGSRPMVDTYALMALPMGAFFQYSLSKSKLISIPILIIATLLLSLNLFQTFQKRKGIIQWDSMTEKAYWKVFLKTELTHDDCIELPSLVKEPDYDKAIKTGEE